MRMLASLQHYVVAGNDSDLVIHQYISGDFTSQTSAGEIAVTVTTDLPWSGTVDVLVTESPASRWTMVLRVPQWADQFNLSLGGIELSESASEGWLRVTRHWRKGDVLTLELAMPPRLTKPDTRVDATRGCVAIERGPLVYCIEQVDQDGFRLDDVVLDVAAPIRASECPELGGVVQMHAAGHLRHRTDEIPWWPYLESAHGLADTEESMGQAVELTAIPYYMWGNRETSAMRVWLPRN